MMKKIIECIEHLLFSSKKAKNLSAKYKGGLLEYKEIYLSNELQKKL